MSFWWVWQKKGISGWGDDSNTTSTQWRYFSINSVPLLNECKAQELFISYEWIISNPDQRQKQQWFLSLRKQNNTPGLSGKFLFHPAPALRNYQLKNTNKKPSVIEDRTLFPLFFCWSEQRSHSCWYNKYFSSANIKMPRKSRGS